MSQKNREILIEFCRFSAEIDQGSRGLVGLVPIPGGGGSSAKDHAGPFAGLRVIHAAAPAELPFDGLQLPLPGMAPLLKDVRRLPPSFRGTAGDCVPEVAAQRADFRDLRAEHQALAGCTGEIFKSRNLGSSKSWALSFLQMRPSIHDIRIPKESWHEQIIEQHQIKNLVGLVPQFLSKHLGC